MLPDYSTKKPERSANPNWPARFKLLSPREPKKEFFGDDQLTDFVAPSVELSDLPDLPLMSDPLSEVPDQPKLDTTELLPLVSESAETGGSDEPQTSELNTDSDAPDIHLGEEENLPEVTDLNVNSTIESDPLQQILDRVDGALSEALDPLVSNISEALLLAMKSILCKDVQEEGLAQIKSFIETMVPKSNDLTVKVSGPEHLVEEMRQQLNAMEDRPSRIEFLVKDQATDLIVTYDTTSMSTRLGELETLLLEAVQ